MKITRIRAILGAGVLLAIAIVGGFHRYQSRYDDLISKAAARNGIDFFLVKSLVYEESWFRSGIRGSSGEIGLMQVTRAAASDFAEYRGFPPLRDERLFEPELNLEIGCWYLSRSLDRYRTSPQPVLFALLRYNAGESRSDHWLRLASQAPLSAGSQLETHLLSFVDFPKTRAYARRILQRHRSHNFWF